MTTSKPKRKELSLKEKVQQIRDSAGNSSSQLASQINISEIQVNNILKHKAHYLFAYAENQNEWC